MRSAGSSPMSPIDTPVYVVHEDQDDPEKCTARKLARFHMARLVEIGGPPRGALLLHPYADKALSPADDEHADRGLVALDCSWAKAREAFDRLESRARFRALPFLMAANPVNYGTAFKLSTAEAVAAALFILGREDDAERALSKFSWHESFWSMNREPLEAYAACETSAEVVQAQEAFVPEED